MSRQKAKVQFTNSSLKKFLSERGVTLLGGSVEEMPLAKGVRVEKGIVITNADIFSQIISSDAVFSVTADSSSDGFVLVRPEWNYISRKEVMNRLAVLLGGLVAERIIFGDENVTMGSSSDLSKATQLAINVLYSCGMGSTKASFGNENQNEAPKIIFDNSSETVNKEAKELLVRAEALAEQSLKKQKRLLIKMADYLSDKRSLNREQVADFVKRYAADFDLNDIIGDAEHIFYRRHLKKLAEDHD